MKNVDFARLNRQRNKVTWSTIGEARSMIAIREDKV